MKDQYSIRRTFLQKKMKREAAINEQKADLSDNLSQLDSQDRLALEAKMNCLHTNNFGYKQRLQFEEIGEHYRDTLFDLSGTV